MESLPRAIAHAAATPSARAWREICAWLSRLPPGAAEDYVDTLQERMASWPHALCTAPWVWVDGLVNGDDIPGWRLVRSLELGGWASARRPVFLDALSDILGESASLARIRSLDLSDNGIDDPDIVAALAACAPPELERLSLAGNPLGRRTLAALRHVYFPRLRRLDLARTDLTSADASRLGERIELPGLTHLSLAGNPLGDAGLAALAQSEALAELEILELGDTRSGDAGARSLADSSVLARLRCLDLRDNPVGPAGAAALGAAAGAPRLEELVLRGSSLGGDGLRALADGPLLAGLRALDLARSGITDTALEALTGPALRGVRRLDLGHNFLGDAAAGLLESEHGADLEEVTLTDVGLTRAGFERIASGRGARVRSLTLDDNRPGPAGVAALAGSEALPALRELSLRGCGLDARGAARLEGPTSERLRTLALARNRLWAPGAKALASRALPHLASLDVAECALGPDGLRHLLGAPWLESLRRLDLSGNGLNDAGAAALSSSPALQRLEQLGLASHFAITDMTAKLLARSPHLRRLAELDLQGTQVTASGGELLVRSRGLISLSRVHLSIVEAPDQASADPLRSLILSSSQSQLALKTRELATS